MEPDRTMRLETLALRARRLRALLGRDGGPQVAAEPAEPAEPVAEVTRVGLCRDVPRACPCPLRPPVACPELKEVRLEQLELAPSLVQSLHGRRLVLRLVPWTGHTEDVEVAENGRLLGDLVCSSASQLQLLASHQADCRPQRCQLVPVASGKRSLETDRTGAIPLLAAAGPHEEPEPW
ncbi:unnamed protein product, partial [Durusdinium trenchii]